MDVEHLLQRARLVGGSSSLRFGRRVGTIALLVGAVLFYLILCAMTVRNQVTATQMLHETRVGIDKQVDGTERRPFIYRRMTPKLMEWVAEHDVFAAIVRYAPITLENLETATCGVPGILDHATCQQVMSLFIVLTAFMAMFAFAIHAVFYHFYRSHILAIGGTLFAIFTNNALVLRGTSHVYDFGSLFFSAAMLLFMLKRQNALFTIVLLVGCINKETTVLFAPIALIFNVIEGRIRSGIAYIIAQGVIYIAIEGYIHHIFANNSGGSIEVWTHRQPGYYMATVTLENLPLALFALLIIFSRLRSQHPDLKVLALLLPGWFCLLLLGSFPGELRNLTEVLPILVMLAFANMLWLLKSPFAAATAWSGQAGASAPGIASLYATSRATNVPLAVPGKAVDRPGRTWPKPA